VVIAEWKKNAAVKSEFSRRFWIYEKPAQLALWNISVRHIATTRGGIPAPVFLRPKNRFLILIFSPGN